jgi:hypothetical protein
MHHRKIPRRVGGVARNRKIFSPELFRPRVRLRAVSKCDYSARHNNNMYIIITEGVRYYYVLRCTRSTATREIQRIARDGKSRPRQVRDILFVRLERPQKRTGRDEIFNTHTTQHYTVSYGRTAMRQYDNIILYARVYLCIIYIS